MSALDVRCQIVEVRGDVIVAKCGLVEKRQRGRIPPTMTAWGSLVSCPDCKGKMAPRLVGAGRETG